MKPDPVLLAAAIAVAVALPACSDGNALEHYARTVSEYGHPGMARVGDGELKARVDAALAADGQIKAGAITVSARKGEVTMVGVVPIEQIHRADAIVRDIPGVRVVINALRPALPMS